MEGAAGVRRKCCRQYAEGKRMEIIKVGMLAVLGVMIALQLKGGRQEYGIYMGIVLSVIIFAFAIDGLGVMLGRIKELQKYLGESSSLLMVLLKAVGITYVCEFCAAICKDAGYGAVAGQVEIFGKLSVLLMGLPILTAVIENIISMAD